MRLTVYGNNATCPEADGACSSFLVQAGTKRILLDMGCGSLAKLQCGADLASLDLIVISHLHFDHFGDLFCAKYQLESRMAYGETLRPIPLLAPALPGWAQKELCPGGVFEPHAVTDGFDFSLGEVQLTFVQNVHLVESYGVRLSSGGRTLAYSGDTGACPQLLRLAAKADALLCEASFPARLHAEEGHHLSGAAAGALAARAGARQLLLTHFHTPQAQEVLREARAAFPAARLTRIGAQYEV